MSEPNGTADNCGARFPERRDEEAQQLVTHIPPQSENRASAERGPTLAERLLDLLAMLVLAGACVLCAVAWRPDVRWESFITLDDLPPAPSAALKVILEDAIPVAYRLLLVGVIGLAAWRGLPGRRRWVLAPLRLLAVIALACGTFWWRTPSLAEPALLVSAAAVAVWAYLLGRALERGLGSAIGWVLLSSVAAAVLIGVALNEIAEDEPAVAGMPVATGEDRERWRQMLRTTDDDAQKLARLRLTGSDLNLMVASWLAAEEWPASASMEMADDELQSWVTVPVEIPKIGQRFVNLQVDWQPTILDGDLTPQLTRLKVGPWTLPTRILSYLERPVDAALDADEQVRRSLSSIRALNVEGQELLVVCEPEQAVRSVGESEQASPDATAELRNAVRDLMQRIVDAGMRLPAGDQRFLGLLQIAFSEARARSASRDAAEENRAALIALGILIGDARVRRLAGLTTDDRLPDFRRAFENGATLRDRNDLARHFIVSAALRSLSSKEWTFAVGLIKEQLDAADGGSGFSFADLGADFAGVQFAERATGSEAAARRLQLRMAGTVSVDDLMPPIDGLPEGLSREEFRDRFGSMTDPRFLKIATEFRERMQNCELLRVEPASRPTP